MNETAEKLYPTTSRKAMMIHLIIAVLFIGGFYAAFVRRGAVGSDIGARIKQIENAEAEVLFVGNSILDWAINIKEYEQATGIQAQKAYSNGSASAWWYLYVKNVLGRAEHQPRVVVLMFRDHALTEPRWRVTDTYQRAIRMLMTDDEPLVEELSYGDLKGISIANSPITWLPREARLKVGEKVRKRMGDLCGASHKEVKAAMMSVFDSENMVREYVSAYQFGFEQGIGEDYDFLGKLDRSYLPAILDLLQGNGIRVVLVRHKKYRDVQAGNQPAGLVEYGRQMREYLDSRGVMFIDFTDDTEIVEDWYGAGDHFSREGRVKFTRLLAKYLSAGGVIEGSKQ